MEEEIGKVTHYFGKIDVAGIEITRGTLRVGDTIHVHGHTSDFTAKIDSMQIDGEAVEEATAGQNVGLPSPNTPGNTTRCSRSSGKRRTQARRVRIGQLGDAPIRIDGRAPRDAPKLSLGFHTSLLGFDQRTRPSQTVPSAPRA